jgi:hypothetical protein
MPMVEILTLFVSSSGLLPAPVKVIDSTRGTRVPSSVDSVDFPKKEGRNSQNESKCLYTYVYIYLN